MNGQTRYHAEVKVTLEGRECRINAFRDTLAEIFQDINNICAQFPPDWKNPALREIINAERKAEDLRQNGHLPKKPEQPTAGRKICPECGSTNTELITWNDKVTGQPKQAWKCQDCKQWLPTAQKR